MRANSLIISVSALWSHLPGVWGQRIKVNEPTPDLIPIETTSKIVEEPSLPDEAMIEVDEDNPGITEQVAINRTDTNPSNPPPEEEQTVPISAILFNGSPGPKDCRGSALLRVALTKPGSQHSTPTCYNVPGGGVAQCGNFLANKADGCQARVFSELECRTFANLAVFIPEARAFGGYMRSIEVTCGVVSEAPPMLDLPGLELPPGAVQAVG